MRVSTTRLWALPIICALITAVCLLTVPLNTLQAAEGGQTFDNGSVQNRLSIDAGYRQDDLDWSIAV